MNKFFALLLSFCLVGAYAYAQIAPESQTQNGITYISGGIGQEGIEAMRAIRPTYNLRLVFAAQSSGQFLADVNVRLADQQGRALLETASDGPYFFAKVKPGRYMIAAETEGRTITKTAEVPEKGAATVLFHWPAAK